MSDIAEIVAETVPKSKIEYAPGAGPDPRCYRVNCDKLRSWSRRINRNGRPGAAAKQVYEAIKKYGLTLEEFEGAEVRAPAAHEEAHRRRNHGREILLHREGDESGVSCGMGVRPCVS